MLDFFLLYIWNAIKTSEQLWKKEERRQEVWAFTEMFGLGGKERAFETCSVQIDFGVLYYLNHTRTAAGRPTRRAEVRQAPSSSLFGTLDFTACKGDEAYGSFSSGIADS